MPLGAPTRCDDHEQVVEETAAVWSVEVSEDAKGAVHIKGVKTYHADVSEASRQAVAAYFETRRLVDDRWPTIFDFLAGAIDAHEGFATRARLTRQEFSRQGDSGIPMTKDILVAYEHDAETLGTLLDGLKATCGLPDGYVPRSER